MKNKSDEKYLLNYTKYELELIKNSVLTFLDSEITSMSYACWKNSEHIIEKIENVLNESNDGNYYLSDYQNKIVEYVLARY